MKQRLEELIKRIHLAIFGHEMGSEMKKFLKNLSWSFLGGGIASVVVFVINILAARLMGPGEYGKYSLALVFMDYFLIASFWGLDIASVRATSKSKNFLEASKNIASSAFFIFFSMTLVSVLAVAFSGNIAALLKTDRIVILLAIVLSVSSGLKLLFNGYIQGIQQFKFQFFGRIIETLSASFVFVLFFLLLKRFQFSSYIFVIAAGCMAVSFIYFPRLKPYLSKFDKKTLAKQFSYSKLFLLSSILGTVFLSVDKLIINRYISVLDLGIYMAYYTVAVSLITQLSQMFNNVFLPTVAKQLNQTMYSKLTKLIYIAFSPALILIIGIVYMTILLFGKKYGVQLNLVISFGIFGLLRLLLSTLNSILITCDRSVYKKYVLHYNLVNAFFVLLYIPVVYLNMISLQSIVIVQLACLVFLIVIQDRLIRSTFCSH